MYTWGLAWGRRILGGSRTGASRSHLSAGQPGGQLLWLEDTVAYDETCNQADFGGKHGTVSPASARTSLSTSSCIGRPDSIGKKRVASVFLPSKWSRDAVSTSGSQPAAILETSASDAHVLCLLLFCPCPGLMTSHDHRQMSKL